MTDAHRREKDFNFQAGLGTQGQNEMLTSETLLNFKGITQSPDLITELR